MKVTIKGQVTIPQAIRNYLGITPNTEVDFVLHEEHVLLVTKESQVKRSRFQNVVGIIKKGLKTDDIMKMTRN